MIKWRKWVRELAIFVVVLAAFSWGMDQWRKPTPPEIMHLPDVTLISGQTVSLAELSADKPLLIYFWATWCGVCKLTSPMVEGLHSDGMNVLSVAIRSGDNERLMRGMAAKGITFPVVNDELGRLSAEWNISATPTFVILEQGKMVSSTSGWSSAWGVKFRMWWADARIFSNLAD